LIDLVCVKTKPFAQNFTCVLSKLGDGLMSGVRPPSYQRSPPRLRQPS
jgi:hypothetical protein